MVHRILLFVFLLLPFFSVAQVVDTAMVHRDVDSLVQLNRKLVGESKYKEALQVIEVADSMARIGFGESNVLYAKCLHNHARTLYFLRIFDKAERLFIETLTIMAKTIGKNSLDYAKSLVCLADNYQEKSEYDSAESRYLECLAIQENLLGKSHPDYAATLANLAVLYQENAEYGKSEAINLEALAICEKTLGKEHSQYLNTLSSLANGYFYQGEYEKAKAVYLETLTITEKVLGKRDPIYSRNLNNLATLYSSLEEYDKAETLWLEDIKLKEQTLGKEHPDYAGSLTNMAGLYKNKGEYDKAEQMYLESISIKKKILGKNHPSYAISLNNIASLYREKGQFDKAEKLCTEAISIEETLLGKEHPDYAKFLSNLAGIYRDKGEYIKSEQKYLESKSIIEKVLGKEHMDYTELVINLAILYSDIGEDDKAIMMFIDAMKALGSEYGKENLNYAWCLNNLASIYFLKKEYSKAESLFLEAGAIFEKILGKEHPDYASNLSNLTNVYYVKGDLYKADSLNLESMKIRERTFGIEHPDYASNLINKASICYKKGEKENVEHLLLEALSIQKKALGKEHSIFIDNLNNLANIYRELGQLTKSEPYFIEVSYIQKRILRKSATFLPSQDLEKYINIHQNKIDAFYSFNHQAISDSFRIESYNNALFYKGFALEATARLELAMQSAPDSIRDIHSRWKGYNRLLSAELALPIAERKYVVYLDSMSNTLEKVLLRASSVFAETQRQIEWQDVRDALQLGEAAIEFIHYRYSDKKETDSTMYSALVTAPGDKAPQFIPLCEARQLDELINKANGTRANYLLNLYASPRPDGLPSLYQLLWAPVEKVLREHDIKTVYYSPTGLLHRLNFSAIAEGKSGARLADKYKLVPMGSTRILAEGPEAGQLTSERSAERHIKLADALIYGGVRYEMDSNAIHIANTRQNATAEDTTGGLFGFSNQTEGQRGENWDYLPGTEKEARYLDGLLHRRSINTTLRLGYDATEESFKQIGQNGPSPSLLHIGTHGFFFPDPQDTSHHRASLNGDEPVFKISEYSMIRSGLKLAGSKYAWENGHPLPGGHEDGILTAYEVSQMNLSNTQLVVLSACETGLGDIRGNEGVYGLQRAFRIAGAKNVLMSLWKVPDDATEKLMTRFYSNWLTGNIPLRESFEEAQKWLRGQKGFENPYYWAGFVLI